MSSKPKSQTQEKMPEIEFLNKFRCIEERKENKPYTIYNCDASLKINKDNIKDVVEQALNVAQQFNAVIRLFRVFNTDPAHSISITVTKGGLITFDIRFPTRIGGYQNSLTVRLDEVETLKLIIDKLVELVQALSF